MAMKRREFLQGSMMLASGVVLGQEALPAARPDVLFLSIEDFSPHRLGCHGDPVCKSPSIDAFAASGVRFDLAHCSASPCNPSRTSMLSGLRPATTGITGNTGAWHKALKPGSTLPEHFAAHGYETVRCGKMFHAGNSGKSFGDKDRWTRIVAPNDGLPRIRSKRKPRLGPGIEYGKLRKEAAKRGEYLKGGSPFTYGPSGRDDLEEVDGRIAEQGIRILQEKQEKPLFLALGFHSPHLPFCAPQEYFDMYADVDVKLPKNPGSGPDGLPLDKTKTNKLNPYTVAGWKAAIVAHYAALSFVDAQVGRVLTALRESGRDKNTIVVLWSDHGFMLGEHFLWRKGPLYDHSSMVAMMIRAPGVTSPNGICTRPTESIDLFPTLCDLCGIPVPEGLEGISMRPLLADPKRPWKKGAIITSGKRGRSIVTEAHRYNEYATKKGNIARRQLFDRAKDPGEFTNLAAQPAHAETVARLSALLKGGWQACLPEG